jgi:hypothetical protein
VRRQAGANVRFPTQSGHWRTLSPPPQLPFPLQRRYTRAIRKDPVKSRVAIPAADPPDNNTHRFF